MAGGCPRIIIFCFSPFFGFSPLQSLVPGYILGHTRAVFTWLSKGIGFGFGFGFTTPFGWLVYLLWFWFYDSQVKTALSTKSRLVSPDTKSRAKHLKVGYLIAISKGLQFVFISVYWLTNLQIVYLTLQL